MSKTLARTLKGGAQYASTLNPAVTFLHSAAAQRTAVLTGGDNIIPMFTQVYNWNKDIAIKLAIWLRDPRQGAGERAAAKKIFNLLEDKSEFVSLNAEILAKYGYWKDLLTIKPTGAIVSTWANAIKNGDRLAAKWAPRLDSKYDTFAVLLRDAMQLTNAQYRKLLKEKSQTVEQQLCKQAWGDVNYSAVPSVAMKLYRKAFFSHDADRFDAWRKDKSTKANSAVLYPHQILKIIHEDEALAEKLWENLPNWIKAGESILPMIDVSGSMGFMVDGKVTAMDVAVALGLYVTERQVGTFQGMYLTFSENPQLMGLKRYKTLKERVDSIYNSDWGGTTNFQAAYDLILDTAVALKVKPENMPTMFMCISDMQFDMAGRGVPALEDIKWKYEGMGYKMPKMVFWNMHEAYTGAPATVEDKGVALISGFSPSIMKAVLACEQLDPMAVVYEAIKPYEQLTFVGLPQRL